MDIHPKSNLFLFDSLRLEGFMLFVVNDKEEIINQLLYNFSQCKLKLNQKLLQYSMKFCVETWEKMQQKNKKSINRYGTKPFSFIATIFKVKKSHCMNIDTRKHCAEPAKSKLWKFSAIFLSKPI